MCGAEPADGDEGGGGRRLTEHAACREFGASIAHDLNNLLLPILLLAELTRDELPPGGTLRTNMDKILTAADRSRVYLDRIREFGQSPELERHSVAFTIVVENALAKLRSALPPAVQLREDITESDGRMSADANKIADVVVELGTNAIEAFDGAAGTIEFKASETLIKPGDADAPSGLAAGRYARLQMRDDGPGMSPEAAANALGPFFTSKSDREGRGLGLAIAYGVVSGHGGAILLGSSAAEGTRVEVYLPMIE